MTNEKLTDRQQRLEKFLQHLEEARRLQDDILKYGLDAAYLYVEDVDGDWLEKWGEDEEEQTFVESLTSFLESNDWVAVRVTKQLKDKSVQEVATELEKCLHLPEENWIFGIKNLLADSFSARESNCDDSNELLDLAQELLEKLVEILGSHNRN